LSQLEFSSTRSAVAADGFYRAFVGFHQIATIDLINTQSVALSSDPRAEPVAGISLDQFCLTPSSLIIIFSNI
jgi:hypothetical protein